MDTTTATTLAAAVLIGFVLMGLAMLAVALRVGPRRGTWNQPAAALRRPGRGVVLAMHALAVLHLLAGIVVAAAVPGGGFDIFVVLAVTAGFYVLCANGYSLARSAERRRSTAASDPS